ncbi:MAG: ATP synthase subunit I [Deltaproteobacteria bacterium]|nr:ATP synthase subunit I [Deltaproteobacteria bacterium]
MDQAPDNRNSAEREVERRDDPGAVLLRVERTAYALAGIATLGSLIAQSIPFSLGVVVGAVIGLANFRAIRFIVARGLQSSSRAGAEGESAPRWAFLALFFVKFAVLIAAVYLLITQTEVDTIGLAIGLSTVLLATVAVSFRSALRVNKDG